MKTFGDKIKEIRLSRDMSQDEFANLLGTSKQVISRYETNQRVPKISVAQEYARILGVSLSYLTDDTTENHQSAIDNLIAKHSELFRPKMRKVPLIGGVACGEPIYSPNLDEEFALINEDIAADFALVCKGDSMAGAGISDGDVVYLRKQEMVDNGQIAAVIIGEEVTLKRVYYYRDKNKLILQPENPAYEPLVYTNEELDEIRILGKAVAQLRKIR